MSRWRITRTFSRRRAGRTALIAGIVVAVVATIAPPASAFKPYTHIQTTTSALVDVADDGRVTIEGRTYPVNGAVVDALTDWPEFYNAGVIGPDGFPDLVYGQSYIHPEHAGRWLRHIFTKAWDAQTDPSYSAVERSQILAFAYGYLTHAAGDLWAHTLVNRFAQGTFPTVTEALTQVDKAEIAMRHLIVEGYIGDATAGFDGNKERGPAPDGDISDDSTPGVELPTAAEFGGLKRFIYKTLIAISPSDPTAAGLDHHRGKLIDGFLGLRNVLTDAVGAFDPQPIETLATAWSDAKSYYDNIGKEVNDVEVLWQEFKDCALDDFSCSRVLIFGELVIQAADIGITLTLDTVGALGTLIAGAVVAAGETVALAADALIDAYLIAWRDDIDSGLANWPEVGRGISVALFDPQARRDLQNEECKFDGSETDPARIACEKHIGVDDVLFEELDPFINEHLLSMLGLPDFVGSVRGALQALAEEIDTVLGELGITNPLKQITASVKESAKNLLKVMVFQATGVSIDGLHSMLTEPSSWLDVGEIATINLTPVDAVLADVTALLDAVGIDADLPEFGITTVNLFEPDDHEKVDALLGFEGTAHLEPTPAPWEGFPVPGTRLADSAEFAPGDLAAFDNTATLSKLLLLDGPALDQVLTDITGSPYQFYGSRPRSNIMLTPFKAPDDEWLNSLDSDHGWRSDQRPFATTQGAGNGNFPLFESCILRPKVFRVLFDDWENGTQNFPEDGFDLTSPDPVDSNAPTSTATFSGTTFVDDLGRVFAGTDSQLTVNATDGYWATGDLEIAADLVGSDGTHYPMELTDGETVDLSVIPDGPATLKLKASDPCGTETEHSMSFIVDTTGPAIDVVSPQPDGTVFDTDDVVSIQWTADDGALGSGVKTQSALLDSQAVTNGQNVDPFPLGPGTHTLRVSASDNLSNSSTEQTNFVVRATSASLLTNVTKAYQSGLIKNSGVYSSLKSKLTNAVAAHNKAKHATEREILTALVLDLKAASGKSIDTATANLLIAFTVDLINSGG